MRRGVGPFRIRKFGTNLWLHVDIDSSGMSVVWADITHSEEFKNWNDARKMLARVSERYPREHLEIVPKEIVYD